MTESAKTTSIDDQKSIQIQPTTLLENIDALVPGLADLTRENPVMASKLLSNVFNSFVKSLKESINSDDFLDDVDPKTGVSYKELLEKYLEKALSKGGKDFANLQTMCSIVPRSHTMPNNALMNILQSKPAINTGAFDLVVANPRGRCKEITAYTMVTYTDEQESGVSITDAKLSEYERQVSDALVSLWIEAAKENLPPIFTTDTIFRAMPGGGDKPSAGQKSAITRTIERLRRIHITVDATDEMRKRGVIKDGEVMRFDDYYLSATRAEYRVKNGGQVVQAYKINAEPIVLSYCRLTNQLLTVPAKYLSVQKVKRGKTSGELVAMTPDRQAMTGYLLRRIAVMKRDKKNKKSIQSNTILFDTVFEDVGLRAQSRDKAFDNRKFCYEVLDYEIAVGYIKGYQEQRDGRKIIGVQIIL